MRVLMGLVVMLAGVSAVASDVIGVYGNIQVVTFLPDENAPTQVKVEGVFARANLQSGQYYPPERGYMYFSLNKQYPTESVNEWFDFRKVAAQNAKGGGPFCLGFGIRRDPANPSKAHFNGTVRPSSEKLATPDVYPVAGGAVRVGPEHHECIRLN